MRKFKTISFVVLLSLLSIQNAVAINLNGVVIDEQNKPIEFATIGVLNKPNLVTTTNLNGAFQLENITASDEIIVQHLSFISDTLSNITAADTPLVIQLESKPYILNSIVVSAARSEQVLEEVGLPISVISEKEIAATGLFRLDEILEEQTGLQIVDDHASGLQMQGLSSDYIQILIDGEPVIGRTGGVLDLDRITLNNIDRIEIIKGPSSSIYGSEALAGVVNIITKQPSTGWQANAGVKYRSFNTVDAFVDGSYRNKKFGIKGFLNRNSSHGYDLDKSTIALTAPKYSSYTSELSIDYWITERSKLTASGRFYHDAQQNQDTLYLSGMYQYIDIEEVTLNGDGKLQFKQYFKKGHSIEISNRFSEFKSNYNILSDDEEARLSEDDFKQILNRTNAQVNFKWQKNLHLVSGAGFDFEKVVSSRYKSEDPFLRGYLFSQLDWSYNDKLFTSIGFRFDAHSIYKEQFSPKFSLKYSPIDWIGFKASIGSGYKAPDFRQLVLNFTNPIVGYSVFGSELLTESLSELDASGQIATYLIDPETLDPLVNESSWAFNAGIELNPIEQLKVEANWFRNNVSNLIETGIVATRTNGQSVFSYFNINKVITQGVESNITYNPILGLKITAGYQYLDTKDLDAVKAYENGEIIAGSERLDISSYGGLYNRSKHTANFKVQYISEEYDFSISTRLVYRGKFGFGGETNFTGYLDDESEYADGYFNLDLSVQKQFKDCITLYFSVDNLTNATNEFLPGMPGRTYTGGVSIQFYNNQFKNNN